MKVKLADGTEVEVPDTDPIAVAARELEKVQGLGFDSIEEYEKSLLTQVSTLKKQGESDKEFIDRQKNELGELRKKAGVTEPKPNEGKVVKEEKTEETEAEREVRFAKQNASIQDNLTPEQQKHAQEEFAKQYEASTPQERALLKTAEGRSAFLEIVFPEESPTGKTPISLFEPVQAKPKSIGEQVQEALKKDDKGRSRNPVTATIEGSGYVAGREKPVKKVKRPIRTDGGVLGAVKSLEKQNA